MRIATSIAVLALAACSNHDEPAAVRDDGLVERGAYIAKAAACGVCHTALGPKGPDLAHAYAGGFEMQDAAVGTWRTPNITPDKTTGIGSWTDDQIVRAIREGVRPDGKRLNSIMPYTSYNRMTDDDARALVAFLHTIPPVERTVAPNRDLKTPVIPMPRPENKPDPADDPVQHGAYLASVMLCSHCHFTPGPNNAPAGPDQMFAGGLDMSMPALGTGTLYARNITSDKDTGIGAWSEAQVFTTIRTMVRPDGRQLQGPMLFLQGGWSQLDDRDMHAVAAFVHQLPAVHHAVPASTFKLAGQ